MFVPTDIDQFMLVREFFEYGNRCIFKMCTSNEGTYLCYNSYLPKELFNMAQIEYIDFSILNNGRLYYNYSHPRNNHLCSWHNFTNLSGCCCIIPQPPRKNKDIMKVLKSLK